MANFDVVVTSILICEVVDNRYNDVISYYIVLCCAEWKLNSILDF